jgi:proton-translocating NADH-quinone oxidoreductase chain L
MSELRNYLWLIPALPLAAAVLSTLFGKVLKERTYLLPLLATASSCVLSVMVFLAVWNAGHAETAGEGHAAGPEAVEAYYTWFKAGDVDIGFRLRVDALTAMMLVMVTFIGSFIVLFASGYMHGDAGYPRFFAEVSLFIFSMTGLVLADNLILLYAFWEGVGLCSYLLIGFWFEKDSAANAARKAFLVTRLGDVGFFIGILLLWAGFGYTLDLNTLFHTVGEQAKAGTLDRNLLTAACLLLFCGAVGKSAQFPLHVWLPDAMEGPTPVSALIHAATMVTAGVYLVARCTPLFELVPNVQLVVASIGGFTALMAALIALTQTDLKRVLAYSTISQLGYMFMGVGSGAVAAGMFHLFTHAFFKALLFLAAGSVMHAMGGVIDMRRFSGLRKLMPYTHATFLCGALALAGVPFIASGFWSKDDIFAGLYVRSTTDPIYGVLLIVGLITAALTAFYTFRAYFLTFWGEEKVPHEAGHHAHESPPVMWVPLVVLAVGAIGVGYVNAEPFTSYLSHFLATTPNLAALHLPHLDWGQRGLLWGGSIVAALGGVGVAYWMYVTNPGVAGRLARSAHTLYELSLNKFHFDELYNFFVVQPATGFTEFCRVIDTYVVDALVDLVGAVPKLLGGLFRPVQNGLVQFYALAMVLGLVVFLLALARSM